MGNLIIATQLLLSLSILVTLHEYGHFATARWFGMRVEKFYLFLNPWFSLFKVKRGETEYGIGWLPLGGYVKIAGMVDESMDTEQLAQDPQPWEFRSKPAWQRLIVMLGGVIINFIVGFLVFGLILFFYGEKYVPMKNLPEGIAAVSDLSKELGLKDGDIILKVGDTDFERFEARVLIRQIGIHRATTMEIQRNGQQMTLNIPDSSASKLASFKGDLIYYRFPFVIDSVLAGKPAEKAGFKKGDQFIGINGDSMLYSYQFLKKLKTLTDTTITMAFLRNGQKQTAEVTTNSKGHIGFIPKAPESKTQYFGFFEALPLGVEKGWNFLGDQVKAFGLMFSGDIKPSEGLGGLGTMASLFSPTWDWHRFWYITAVLSLVLGFMNLLPIPALDGGHVVFLLYEMITGRAANQKVLEYAQVIGFLILIALMLYANGLDIYRAFFK